MARPELTGRKGSADLNAGTPRRTVNRGRDDPDEDALVISILQAGKLLGLGRNASYEAARKHAFPTVKINGREFVPKAAIPELLEAATAEWRQLQAQKTA